jgi:flagellar motor switch protein FliN
MSKPQSSGFESFLEVWTASFAKVMTQLGAAEVQISEAHGANLSPTGPDQLELLAVRFVGGRCLQGQLQFRAPKKVAVQCAQLLMSEPLNLTAEFTATHLDGFLEFLRQVAGDVSVEWKNKRGAAAELAYRSDASTAFATQSSAALLLDCDKCKGLELRMDLDAEMFAALSDVKSETAPAGQETVADELPEQLSATEPQNLPSNLNLILDVQLDATIRFGEKEMLLKEVFALMPGSVVELDQLVNERAELRVAGRLVAKGEVIVVDGNFGLRVQEVVSPAQRVMALGLD